MNPEKVLPIALAAALAAGACSNPPELHGIRDVRPTTLEVGERMVLETSAPLTAGLPTEVELYPIVDMKGTLAAEPLLVMRGRATAPAGQAVSTRVVVDADPLLEAKLHGHARIRGKLVIKQPGSGQRLESAPLTLDFFPPTVRKLAYGLVGGRSAGELTGWLGLEIRHEQAGLRVTAVRQGFNALEFIAAHDCGVWSDRDQTCRAPLDARLDRGEAKRAGVPEDRFSELDSDRNGQLDRREGHHHNRGPSPAALAGIRTGDLIKTAGGREILEDDDLLLAWSGEGDKVAVTLDRGGTPVTLDLPRWGKPASIPGGFLLAGLLVAVGLLVILPVPVLGGLIVVWERKISGRMQSRPGPNRVGPNGWLQWLADGVKLIVKEDVIPTDADPILFLASPYLVFMGVFATFVVLPFSQVLVVADLNIGILYLLSVTSLVVVGIIMGGWASNSKWSLLGGMRSAAQIISYELPASIAILSVVTLCGTLSPQGIVHNQGGAPWNWHLFDNPFTFCCFFIYFISALAEGNRTPFDLPEAESELVAGYNTEYSGFRFSIFALAEWVNLIVIGAVATTVFLGGWHIPGVSPWQIEHSLALQLASFGVFAAKTVTLIFVIIWIRWTLPRFRVDQMMNMCWKYFLPISLVSFIAVTALVWLAPYPTLPRLALRYGMFAVFGVGTLVYFISRVRYTRRTTKVLELRGA